MSVLVEAAMDPSFQLRQARDGLWSIPVALSRRSPLLVLRGIAVTWDGQSFASAGLNVHGFDASPFDPRLFTVVTPDGEVVAGPKGDWTFSNPVLTSSTSGDLTLLWGEPGQKGRIRETREWPAERIEFVWQATLNSKLQWSVPTLLTKADQILWDRSSLSISSGKGVSVGLVVIVADGPMRELRLLEHADRWLIRRRSGARPDGLRIRSGTPVTVATGEIAVVAVATDQLPRDVVAIAKLPTAADQINWRTIYAAQPGARISDMSGLVARDGDAFLVFLETDLRGRQSVHILRRRNGTTTWRNQASLNLEFEVKYIRSAIHPKGQVHLLAERSQLRIAEVALFHARFDTRWSQMTELFKGLNATDAVFGSSSTGAPVLFFTQMEGGNVSTVYSRHISRE